MTVKDNIRETAGKAQDTVAESYRSAKARAAGAYESAAARTGEFYEGARESAATAGERTGEAIRRNPLAALFGGLAIGGLIGALLPGSRREKELIGPYGREVNDRARGAASAAARVGREKLDEFGFVRDDARETAEKVVSKSKSAASEAGSAAAKEVKGGS